MKIRAMGDELFHAGGRTQMTKLFAILRTRLKTTKKKQPNSLTSAPSLPTPNKRNFC
jgi:hypothetical protein